MDEWAHSERALEAALFTGDFYVGIRVIVGGSGGVRGVGEEVFCLRELFTANFGQSFAVGDVFIPLTILPAPVSDPLIPLVF